MKEYTASRTALATSLMRAFHTRLDPAPLIHDPWGDRLVPDSVREMFLRLGIDKLDDPQSLARLDAAGSLDGVLHAYFERTPAYGAVIIRTRYTEDALEAAVARGVLQYVIIGAGFDSFALRQPAFARELEIYEVDHPATQGLKLQRLTECGVSLPKAAHFIPSDLSQESLSTALARSSFRRDSAAFFSWLGVSVYLTREANLATLGAVAASSAPTSEIAFTYLDQGEFDPACTSSVFDGVKQDVASLGESWVSGFYPTELAAELGSVGLELIEDLDGEQMAARYSIERAHRLCPAASVHIARARVAA